IEECEASGASDAGIYVGQSQNIIVRRCRAERNVAGIEIENCDDADVYDNTATDNAGGLLVFDLPDLQKKNGRRIRVFNNKVHANNHVNFATPGSKVGSVAPGTGVMVLASKQVEVFKNEIKDNQTYNLAVVSYHITGRKIEDPQYDPVPEAVYVHDNTFSGGGTNPAGERGKLLEALLGKPVPDILYDGITKEEQPPADKRVYFKNNGSARCANLKWGVLGPKLAAAKNEQEGGVVLFFHRSQVDRDAKRYEGELPPLPEVKLAGVR